jgi:hypothetical protein
MVYTPRVLRGFDGRGMDSYVFNIFIPFFLYYRIKAVVSRRRSGTLTNTSVQRAEIL